MSDSQFNVEAYFDSLPINISHIDINDKNLSYIPTSIIRFSKLKYLECSYNKLTSLPLLPDSLTHLFCDHNELTYLPKLPKSLKYLQCTHNRLLQLPIIPDHLRHIKCNNNQLTSLPIMHDYSNILFYSNPVHDYIIDIHNINIQIFGFSQTIEIINNLRKTYYSKILKRKMLAWHLYSKRKNYLMILDGMKPNEAEHHYILNQYVGMDIMSYV
jgi:Leucine-rich repeat (LRR) protein